MLSGLCLGEPRPPWKIGQGLGTVLNNAFVSLSHFFLWRLSLPLCLQISTVMAACTATLRYPSSLSSDLLSLLSCLIPVPRCHFLMCGYTPLTLDRCVSAIQKTTVMDVMRRLLQCKNIMVGSNKCLLLQRSLSIRFPSRDSQPTAGDRMHAAIMHVHAYICMRTSLNSQGMFGHRMHADEAKAAPCNGIIYIYMHACMHIYILSHALFSICSYLYVQVSTSLRRGLYMSLLNVIRGEADPLQVLHKASMRSSCCSCVSLSPSLPLSLCLSVCLSLCLSISLSISLCLSLCLSLYIYISLYIFLYLCLSLSVCLLVSFLLSLSPWCIVSSLL